METRDFKTRRALAPRRAFTRATLSLGLAAAAALTSAWGAETLVLDAFREGDGGSSTRNAGDSPIAVVEVTGTEPVAISRIEVRNDLDGAANLRFMIWDHATGDLVYQSVQNFPTEDGGYTWKSSAALNFTLAPGATYSIGAIADVYGLWSYGFNASTGGGLTAVGDLNSNVEGFESPVLRAFSGGASIHLRLYAGTETAADSGLTVLFSKGGAIPGAGEEGNPFPAEAVWDGFGSPAVNRDGDLAFVASYRAGKAKYKNIVLQRGETGAFEIAAAVKGPVPGAGVDWELPADATFGALIDPILAPDGSVLFLATIKGTGVTSENSRVLVHHHGDLAEAPARVVLRAGVPIPALGGASLKTIAAIAVESGGAIVARGNLTLGSGSPAVTKLDDAVALAVLRSPEDAALSVLLREGSSPGGDLPAVKKFQTLVAAPGAGGQGRGWLLRGVGGPVVGEPGPAIFTAVATYADGSRALIQHDLEAGGTPVAQQITGKTAGGMSVAGQPDSFFKSIGVPIRWMAPEAFAFRGTPSVDSAGIFLGDLPSQEAQYVYSVFSATPITGVSFKALKDPVVSPAGNIVAFPGAVMGEGVTSASDSVLAARLVHGAIPQIIAREGAEAAGTDGAVWKTFTSLAVPGAHIGALFTAKLVNRTVTPEGNLPGPGGTTAANDVGLWAMDGDGEVHLLLREGQPIGEATVKSFNVLKIAGAAPGTTRSFSSSGEVVALVSDTSGGSHIVSIALP